MNVELPGSNAKKNTLSLGAVPRVDLLPPEIRLHQQSRRLRRKLATGVAGAALVVAVGFGGTVVLELQAEARLAAEQQRTAALVAEQAQYSEVIDVNRRIGLIETARSLGTSTEVLWKRILDEYRSALPDGATITSAALTGRAPWEPQAAPAGPLRSASVAQVAITAVTDAVPDATAWLRRIAELPTIADASLNTIASVDGAWTTTVTFNVNTEGLAGRFPDPEGAPASVPGTGSDAEPVEAAAATGANE
ncbi:hypothetical protein ACFFGH_23060 [Lysobacter korlensis]|uniref:Fimbrial assembly protein n=1 Tax=Lysobacter korlensis TaxID=553636 RepID=A0ABV6RUS0_9GAMM